MTAIEERLSRALQEVADRTQSRPDWDRVVADGGSTSTAGDAFDRARGHRPRLMAAAAVVVALAAGAVGLGLIRSDDSAIEAAGVDLVVPGEVVIGTDPLVVMPAPTPEPEFDVTELGTEVVFEPIDRPEDVADLADTVLTVGSGSPDQSVTKVTAVGRVDGIPWAVVVTDEAPWGEEASPDDHRRRSRWVVNPGGGGGGGDLVPADSLAMIAPILVSDDYQAPNPGFDFPEGWLSWDTQLADIAVVTFADADQQMWIRPRAGVAIFPVQFESGERFTLEALDSTGRVVARFSEAIVDDSVDLTAPEVGDQFGSIRGIDEKGQSVEIDGDGRSTVLVFGASWCAPCRELDEVIDTLGQLDPSVRVYAVPFEEVAEGVWPGDAWPYEILILDDGTAIQPPDGVPSVMVFDGTNTLIREDVGADELEDVLVGAGLLTETEAGATGD